MPHNNQRYQIAKVVRDALFELGQPFHRSTVTRLHEGYGTAADLQMAIDMLNDAGARGWDHCQQMARELARVLDGAWCCRAVDERDINLACEQLRDLVVKKLGEWQLIPIDACKVLADVSNYDGRTRKAGERVDEGRAQCAHDIAAHIAPAMDEYGRGV